MISKKMMIILYGYDDYKFMCVDCYANGEWFPSLHDVAHKCKEWAESSDGKEYYCIKSFISRCHSPIRQVARAEVLNMVFDAPTEPEAVFKACEWILNQMEEK